MQVTSNHKAPDFHAALVLLGEAISRLPFGVEEPVLVGHSALELYSGGIWSFGELELITDHPRALRASLMAEGFRWTDRPRHVERGLWYPQLRIAAEIVGHTLPDDVADPVATLTVELDSASDMASQPVQLRVIGIEDLITELAADWIATGSSRGEIVRQMRMLMELGQAGVGGPLRFDYLQCRLAEVTGGEVELGVSQPRFVEVQERARRITETAMQAAIHAWRVRRGMAAPVAGWASSQSAAAASRRSAFDRDECGGSEGDVDFSVSNVVAMDRRSPSPRR